MQVNLKSNRKFILYSCLPVLILGPISYILLVVGLVVDYESAKSSISVEIVLLVINCVQIPVILVAKYKKGKSYLFDNNEIFVYNKDILQVKIPVSNIKQMHYCPFRFRDMIVFAVGGFSGYPPMQIYLEENDGKKHILGFIGQKDAKRLKELYPELLTLHFIKNNK